MIRVHTYGQYCPVAKALDVVGDRWTLLIVRELLMHGVRRYTDLRQGLPGIATNLLADRLRELEAAGLVVREEAAPPIATAVFRLTDRGAELKPVLRALGTWGAPLLGKERAGARGRDHWLASPVALHLADRTPGKPPISIQVTTGGERVVIEAADGELRVRTGVVAHPDASLAAPPSLLVAVLTHRIDLAQGRAQGLRVGGNPTALHRLGLA